MLVTSHVREFYFALHDLAHGVGGAPDDWQSERSSDDQKSTFESILKRLKLTDALEVMAKLSQADRAEWPVVTAADGRRWRTATQTLAGRWPELDECERFVVLQQVGSVLRTSLAHDVESRLR